MWWNPVEIWGNAKQVYDMEGQGSERFILVLCNNRTSAPPHIIRITTRCRVLQRSTRQKLSMVIV